MKTISAWSAKFFDLGINQRAFGLIEEFFYQFGAPNVKHHDTAQHQNEGQGQMLELKQGGQGV